MNVLKKCCYRSIKENRKRVAVTIIGIILATALITAVACMASSFRESMIVLEKKDNGDFHYLFTGVAQENLKYFQNNQNVEKIGLAEEIGYAVLEGCTNPDKPYIYIRAVDASGIRAMALELSEGRMPWNEDEIVISRHIHSNGDVDLGVGDTLTVQVGERISEGYFLNQSNPYMEEEENFVPAYEKTYTIVGIIERPNFQVEARSAPGYSVFTYMENTENAESLEVYVSYTKDALKHGDRVTAGLLGISLEEYESNEGLVQRGRGEISRIAYAAAENHNVVRWELMRFSSTTMNMLYGMAVIAILIIIITSVFCIRNSFLIALNEKMKLYGRLASVGTTSGQQRKIIYYEAGFQAAVGVPLGILSGILATVVVVKVTGGMMESQLGVKLIFSLSVPAIVLAALLALLTVYLSASGSARRAARLTPISAIRADSTVKISRRELRCPKIIEKLFGIGGKLAYRNLQRAKVKYRTTVISIVVSVAVFIGVYSFIGLVAFATTFYYDASQYQLLAYIYDEDSYEQAKAIAALDGVERAEIRRWHYYTAGYGQMDIPFTQEYLNLFGRNEAAGEVIIVVALGEEGYERYCRDLGVDPETATDKAIVIARYEYETRDNKKWHHYEGNIAEYHSGDMIDFMDDDTGEVYEIPVLLQTDILPISMSGSIHNNVQLIVSESWWEAHDPGRHAQDIGVYICCEDADAIEETIRRDFNLRDFNIYNYDREYRSSRGMYLAVAIFLYGFIIVVSLIGVTNIFNTVTTNMELRAPEIAMCKSVGMTRKEFRRMIWLEGMFYGGKGLLFGILLGILISLGFHKTMGAGLETGYKLPAGGILISAAAVFLLLFCIMNYSMSRFHSKNIVETIRNENI
ncbi:MAG: ABC transporter permease [Acetatifactor sp.]|nr:ABC transporter permease [Acetatifactor sp.]